MRRYTAPALLILDGVGYLPIDQRGADLLFQVISARYERGSILLTTNKAFKQWPLLFNGDATIEVTCGGSAAGEGDLFRLAVADLRGLAAARLAGDEARPWWVFSGPDGTWIMKRGDSME
jgi:hypothetical protein